MIALALLAILSTPATEATRFAPIYPAEPERSHLDLGPVLIREGAQPLSQEALNRELDLAARALGADGLIFERRDLRDVYLIRTDGSVAATVALNIASALLGGTFLSEPKPSSVSITTFHRAFRFVKAEPPKADAARAPVPNPFKNELATARDRTAQLGLAHRWLAEGRLEVGACVELRRFLVGRT